MKKRELNGLLITSDSRIIIRRFTYKKAFTKSKCNVIILSREKNEEYIKYLYDLFKGFESCTTPLSAVDRRSHSRPTVQSSIERKLVFKENQELEYLVVGKEGVKGHKPRIQIRLRT